ncbi:hypothetical protein B9L20_27905 [Serratia marcescens]|nr:hypothetical protein B9L20_27905 [Serratia marcescens]
MGTIRFGALDNLKFLSAILIISMHVHNLGMESIYSYSLVNGLFRYAVPFFFIVNGYFLITSIEKSGFYTWVKRVIILYTL